MSYLFFFYSLKASTFELAARSDHLRQVHDDGLVQIWEQASLGKARLSTYRVADRIQHIDQIAKRMNFPKMTPKLYEPRQHLHFVVGDVVLASKVFVLSQLPQD